MDSNDSQADTANAPAPRDNARAFLQPQELAALNELRQVLRLKFEMVRLTLIGSKARGDSDSESDIDVVIVLRQLDSRTRFELFDLCFEIGLKYDVLIQPIPYSEQSADSPLIRSTPFYQRVIAEGVAL